MPLDPDPPVPHRAASPVAAPLPLTPHQEEAHTALMAFLKGPRGAFVLTGSAGTGKTTLLRTVASDLMDLGRSVAMLAPTGRAARVLGRRTGFPTRTVHAYLYVPEPLEDRPGVRLVRKGLFAEQHEVLIIDEASLVAAAHASSDAFITPAALLDDLVSEAERADAHLVFVGDACQLPPVGEAESVALRPDRLAERYGLRTASAHLSEVLRQGEGSPVLEAATRLRDALEGEAVQPLPMPSCRNPADTVRAYLRAVEGERYLAATMLAYTNRDVYGLNRRVRTSQRLRGLLAPGDLVVTDRDGWADGQLVPRAEPYLVREVEPLPERADLRFARVRLTPCDPPEPEAPDVVGLALLDTLATPTAHVDRASETQLFQMALADNPRFRESRKASDDPHVGALRLRYGHALTVHKAQGGEWPHVFLNPYVPRVVDDETALRWRYTALTRAAEQCTLIGRRTL